MRTAAVIIAMTAITLFAIVLGVTNQFGGAARVVTTGLELPDLAATDRLRVLHNTSATSTAGNYDGLVYRQTQYLVPVDNGFTVTGVLYKADAANVTTLELGYADAFATDSAAAPTGAVRLWRQSIPGDGAMVEIKLGLPVPDNRYLWARATGGSTTWGPLTVYGIQSR